MSARVGDNWIIIDEPAERQIFYKMPISPQYEETGESLEVHKAVFLPDQIPYIRKWLEKNGIRVRKEN